MLTPIARTAASTFNRLSLALLKTAGAAVASGTGSWAGGAGVVAGSLEGIGASSGMCSCDEERMMCSEMVAPSWVHLGARR